MSEYANLILAILLAILAFAFYRSNKALKKAKDDSENVSVSTEISQLKSIGELSVFQVYSKEIVTKTDHAFGNFGKEYLRWLVSEKKLSMIFEFEINFIYDLTSPRLEIMQIANSSYKIKMPPCKYKFSIADMKFYDEKNEVKKMSVRLISQLQSKIHKSARDTLEAIAKSFGANKVEFVFDDSDEQINEQLNLENIA